MYFPDLLHSLECHINRGIHFPIWFLVLFPEKDYPVFLRTLGKYSASIKRLLAAEDTLQDKKSTVSFRIFFCRRDT